MQKNYIDEHTTGVACLDNSNSKINSVARDPGEDDTQHIINNEDNQVYILAGSFPYEFEYNYIYGSDTTEMYVYLNTIYSCGSPCYDVTNNYWGDNGFIPDSNLYPIGEYNYLPLWSGYKNTPVDALIYRAGEQAMEDGNYPLAELKFKEIVEDFPNNVGIKTNL